MLSDTHQHFRKLSPRKPASMQWLQPSLCFCWTIWLDVTVRSSCVPSTLFGGRPCNVFCLPLARKLEPMRCQLWSSKGWSLWERLTYLEFMCFTRWHQQGVGWYSSVLGHLTSEDTCPEYMWRGGDLSDPEPSREAARVGQETRDPGSPRAEGASYSTRSAQNPCLPSGDVTRIRWDNSLEIFEFSTSEVTSFL